MKRLLSPALLTVLALWGCGPAGEDFATTQQSLGPSGASASPPVDAPSADGSNSAQAVDPRFWRLLAALAASAPPKDGSPVSAPQDPIPAVPGGDPRASSSLGGLPAGGARSSDGSTGK